MADNMPQLRSLDKFIVMDFERTIMAKLYPTKNIKKSKLMQLYRFRPFNKETTSWQSRKFLLIDHYKPSPSHKYVDSKQMFIKTDNYQVSSETVCICKHLNKAVSYTHLTLPTICSV